MGARLHRLRRIVAPRAEIEPLLEEKAPMDARAVSQMADCCLSNCELRPCGILKSIRGGLPNVDAEAAAFARELDIDEIDAVAPFATKMRERSDEALLPQGTNEPFLERGHHQVAVRAHPIHLRQRKLRTWCFR